MSQQYDIKKIASNAFFHKEYIFTINESGLHKFNIANSSESCYLENSNLNIFDSCGFLFVYVENSEVVLHNLNREILCDNIPLKNRSAATCISFSKSGVLFAIGFEDGQVSIFSTLTKTLINSFSIIKEQKIEHISFSSDEVLVASSSNIVAAINLLEKVVLKKIEVENLKNIATTLNYIIYSLDSNQLKFEPINGGESKSIPVEDEIALLEKGYKDELFILYSNSVQLINIDTLDIKNIYKNDDSELTCIAFNQLQGLAIVNKKHIATITDDFEQSIGIDIATEKAKEEKIADKNIIRFLTVDDSATMRMILKNTLLNNFDSIEVLEADDGTEAMKIFKKRQDIDVMFLDWNMPKMSGPEVVDEISTIEELKHLKTIMATTEGAKEHVQQMVSKGVKGYLIKPFKPDSILHLTKKIIELINKERDNKNV